MKKNKHMAAKDKKDEPVAAVAAREAYQELVPLTWFNQRLTAHFQQWVVKIGGILCRLYSTDLFNIVS
jgi:hypothetical protein